MFQEIEISELTDGDIILELNENPDFFNLNDQNDAVFSHPIRGEIRFSLLGRDVMAFGAIQTKADVECVRCLKHFPITIAFNFTITFEPNPRGKNSERDSIGERSYLSYFRTNKINAHEDIRQAILLEIPEFPVCKVDCSGPSIQSNGIHLITDSEKQDKPSARTEEWKKKLKEVKLP